MANVDYNEKLKKYVEMYKKLKTYKSSDNNAVLSGGQGSEVYTSIENSSWNEVGKSLIVSNGVPYLKGSLDNINDSINNNLLKANSVLYDKVYPLLEDSSKLKDEYNSLNTQVANTTDPSQLSTLNDRLNNVKKQIDENIANVDNYLLDINNLGKVVKNNSTWLANGGKDRAVTSSNKIDLVSYTGGSKSAEQIAAIKNTHTILEAKRLSSSKANSNTKLEASKKSNSSGGANSKTSPGVASGKTYTLNALDGSWTVAKTPQDLNSYLTKINSNGVYQASNASRYGDSCLAFAEVYGSNLITGNANNAEESYKYCCASSYSNWFNDSQSETMKEVYNQITAGKPVVIQVNGNSQGTCRHFVTVVGFKSSVTSASSLKPTDLLIVDSWDGKLERMDTSTSRFLTTGQDCHKNYSGYYLRILK